ncbi:flagellar protein [Planococcus salinus]|uniref:Flagellar protein n=1 Tax=Planococcus salinus TaxID=1848460 RepID=A0A3M8P525_9BACL|nr:flagellar protein [Planococcus salinus]RNF38767.1 flagellar protein [Planococcus salinus]
MQSAQLDNCTICGQLFLKDHTDYCLHCYRNIERQHKQVMAFLKIEQNRHATIDTVSEATDVPVKQIAEFIREGRIFANDYPNLGYPCAHCGKEIKRQMLCSDCYQKFTSDVSTALKKDRLIAEMTNPQRKLNEAHYWRLKKDK